MARQSSQPTPKSNVTALHGADENRRNLQKLEQKRVARLVKRLRPRGMSPDMVSEWKRVATMLAHPDIDRLKPHFVDVIAEYCRLLLRLRAFRDAMPALANEIYNAAAPAPGQQPRLTRNGVQIKSNPHVAQMNETWRQWARVLGLLGLSPADERNMATGKGNSGDPSDRFFNR